MEVYDHTKDDAMVNDPAYKLMLAVALIALAIVILEAVL